MTRFDFTALQLLPWFGQNHMTLHDPVGEPGFPVCCSYSWFIACLCLDSRSDSLLDAGVEHVESVPSQLNGRSRRYFHRVTHFYFAASFCLSTSLLLHVSSYAYIAYISMSHFLSVDG